MNAIRYFAAGLLLLTGLLHLLSPALSRLDRSVLAVMLLFGVVYLVLGAFLLLNKRTSYYFGTIVPFVGLAVGTFGMVSNPAMVSLMMGLLTAIDIVVVVSCIYLIMGRRRSREA
jgi:uncharacterized membrane protein (DUF2068 family)